MKLSLLKTLIIIISGCLLLGSCKKKDEETTSCAAFNGPKATSNSPVGPGMKIELNAASVSGASYKWVGPRGVSYSGQKLSFDYSEEKLGEYKVYAIVNGCTSDPYTVYVTTDKVVGSANSPLTEGDKLTLTASIIDTATTYRWYKMNGKEPKDTMFLDAHRVFSKNNVTLADSGIYKVIAKSKKGIVSEDTAMVKIHIQDPDIKTGSGDTITVTVGDSLSFKCLNAKADTGYKIVWKNASIMGIPITQTTIGTATLTRKPVTRGMHGTYIATASYRGYTTKSVIFYVNVKYSYKGCQGRDTVSNPLYKTTYNLKEINIGSIKECWATNNTRTKRTATAIVDSGNFDQMVLVGQVPNQGACPDGFHIATKEDWDLLRNYKDSKFITDTLKISTAKPVEIWSSTEFAGNTSEAWVAKFSKDVSNNPLMEMTTLTKSKIRVLARCVKD